MFDACGKCFDIAHLFARAVANNNVVYVHASRPSAICCAPVPPAGRMRSKRPVIAHPGKHPVLIGQRLAAACAAAGLGKRRIVGGGSAFGCDAFAAACCQRARAAWRALSLRWAGVRLEAVTLPPDCADSAAESAQGTPGCTGCVLWLLSCAHGSIGGNGDLLRAILARLGFAVEVDAHVPLENL